MGHAGVLVHHPDGLIEGAADPRGDGQAAGF
jgi:gamma-glutamyltranspeptidase/glutathione hydrolase